MARNPVCVWCVEEDGALPFWKDAPLSSPRGKNQWKHCRNKPRFKKKQFVYILRICKTIRIFKKKYDFH